MQTFKMSSKSGHVRFLSKWTDTDEDQSQGQSKNVNKVIKNGLQICEANRSNSKDRLVFK